MSRTDKDRPLWVRVQDPHEVRLPRHGNGPGPCDAHESSRTELEWKSRNCDFTVHMGKDFHDYRVTHRGEEHAFFRAEARKAIQWHRGDPVAFMENFDLSAESPWRDEWDW